MNILVYLVVFFFFGVLFVVGVLRTFADVVLIGSGVLRASPRGTWLPEKVYPSAADTFAELRRSLGKRETPEVAILSGHGSIDPAHPVLESGAFVLTSTTGAEKLAGRLPAAAEVVPLGEDTTIDGKLVVHALRDRGHRLILSEAGPHTLGTLLQETMGDARLTAETLGHRGLASVSGYTKITDQRRREAYEQMQRRGL